MWFLLLTKMCISRQPSSPTHWCDRLGVVGCGILGVYKIDGAAGPEIYEGLLMLQHRGQDSAGIVTFDGNKFREHKVCELQAGLSALCQSLVAGTTTSQNASPLSAG